MILLTGASGFIGKHILLALLETYSRDKIIAFSSGPSENAIYLPHLNYQFDSDYLVKSGFENVEIIIHAGAFTPKSGNEANDLAKANENIINTGNLLRLYAPSLKKVIFLSTIDVYLNIQGSITEETPISPQSLYGYSKYYCEGMVQASCYQKKVENSILRVGHVYGPGEQAYKKLIPEVMRSLLRGDVVKIWGSGEEIRSFIYIDDVVRSIMSSISRQVEGPVNIVSDVPVTIKEVARTIIEISGVNSSIEYLPSNHIPRDLHFDNTKMRKNLHEPATSLRDGLKIEWDVFRSYYAQRNI